MKKMKEQFTKSTQDDDFFAPAVMKMKMKSKDYDYKVKMESWEDVVTFEASGICVHIPVDQAVQVAKALLRMAKISEKIEF